MENKTSLYVSKVRNMSICYHHHHHPSPIRPW